MDITGARWGLDSAEAILKLRALTASGDFDDYWPFHCNKNTSASTALVTISPHDQLTSKERHPKAIPPRITGVLQTETRSQTKMRVSPGAITCPAPRSP